MTTTPSPTSTSGSNTSGSHLPLPDQDTEEFWAAARQHRLLVRETADGRQFLYPRDREPGTLRNDCRWFEIDGGGVVYSFSVVHQAASRAFKDRVPYVLALIDLDGGARIMSHVESDPRDVEIGARVRLAWRDEDDVSLPVFVLERAPEPSAASSGEQT